MKNIILLIGIFYFVSLSCNNNIDHSSLHNKEGENKFVDTTLQQIMDLQYERNTEGLLKFTDNNSSKYREAMAMAFGSVQDTNAIPKLSELLNDKESEVRIATAFAIGQTGHSDGASILYAYFLIKKNDMVRNQMLEAIGKCGDENILQKIVDFDITSEHNDIISGKAISFARFSIRGVFNEAALGEVIKLIGSAKSSGNVKYNASIALTRMKLESVSEYVT